MERTIKPDALQTLMQTCKDVVVFDVRRKADYDADSQKIGGSRVRRPSINATGHPSPSRVLGHGASICSAGRGRPAAGNSAGPQ